MVPGGLGFVPSRGGGGEAERDNESKKVREERRVK